MTDQRDRQVHQIPIADIEVVNPRQRGRKKFRQIVDNIGRLGLKKPITVTPRNGDSPNGKYYLVCGQGRLEAFRELGQTVIPALVVDATRNELYLMSLVENLARRSHSSVELLGKIDALKERGYSFSEIAKKTDLTISYVRSIVKLLKRGEERLLTAVEKGQIPVNVAITIACSDDHEVQRALTEAYEKNDLRGQRLLAARKLIEKRRTAGKKMGGRVRRSSNSRVTSNDLMKTYQQETNRQRLVIQKSKLCETRLLFVVSALRELFEDDRFVELLKAESLDSLPAYLDQQLNQR
ncbi:MAG: plasmid partitioning protein RepB C-terminal domain-containing protein [Actinomycetota bacterium]